jgi:type II secretory pathway pseudopilin PulG
VELLVVVSITGLLLAVLLPAVGKARDMGRMTISRSNLRQLALAHAAYAADWNDRQVTLVDDNFAGYGGDATSANDQYQVANGHPHPPIFAGWGEIGVGWGYWFDGGVSPGNLMPINFEGPLHCWGWFRLPNFKALNSYVNGRVYDPVFYAPKDHVVWAVLDETDCLNIPYEFVDCYVNSYDGDTLIKSSYCLSPAALLSPDVLRSEEAGGYQDPWTFGFQASLRVPSMSQARYSNLKTQFIEHHWLQNTHNDCNGWFTGGSYDGCEPFYFNLGRESVPVTAFYDGHVRSLGVLEAMSADTRHRQQGHGGLWSSDTPMGAEGYHMLDSWDLLNYTSFHILTTDGIKGRDTLDK